jgi:23S rRNA pseudouridine1911/1915/1917 synthase
MAGAAVQILFENNTYIAVNKNDYIRVQADSSGKDSLQARVANFLAVRQAGRTPKPFLGLVHRIDQPVTGVVLFAKNKDALSRVNALFQTREVKKIYWAVVESPPPEEEGSLEHYLEFDSRQNKTLVLKKAGKNVQRALLHYRIAGKSKAYTFLELTLVTGRHHQCRAQLAAAGCHIKGDLKYGAARSNPGGGIHLHARRLSFHDPVTGSIIEITAPPPKDALWDIFPRRG